MCELIEERIDIASIEKIENPLALVFTTKLHVHIRAIHEGQIRSVGAKFD